MKSEKNWVYTVSGFTQLDYRKARPEKTHTCFKFNQTDN